LVDHRKGGGQNNLISERGIGPNIYRKKKANEKWGAADTI
jgi:hypothetical protein